MTETGRSRWRPTQRTVLIVAAEVAIFWAAVVLIGWRVVGGLGGALLGMAILALVVDRPTRARERAARAAIRAHRDPGPDLREEADTQARIVLGRSVVDRWGALGLSLAIAIACVVTAVVRDDRPVAFPAALLVVVGVGALVLGRRDDAAAERWLADPPVPSEGVDP